MSKRKYPFNYEPFEQELEVLLARDVISGWQPLGPGHYRISGKLDIWPRNKKYGHHKVGRLGPYIDYGRYEDLEKLINKLQFGK